MIVRRARCGAERARSSAPPPSRHADRCSTPTVDIYDDDRREHSDGEARALEKRRACWSPFGPYALPMKREGRSLEMLFLKRRFYLFRHFYLLLLLFPRYAFTWAAFARRAARAIFYWKRCRCFPSMA